MKRNILAAVAFVSFSFGCGHQEAHPTTPTEAGASAAHAHAHQGEVHEWTGAGATFEGYLAYPTDAPTTKKPAIVLFPDWMGVGPNPKKRADQLAELGYVVLVGDLYGKGIRPKGPEEAMKLVGQYKSDRPTMRLRARAALDALLATGKVDPAKIAATGYCFGGTAALELARSGAPLAGTVTFHGGLDTPNAADAQNIKGKVLALHGADDPHVKPAEVQAFEEEMRAAHVDWELVAYGGAVHAFTIEEAGNDNSKGAAYNKKADERSWAEQGRFLTELFGAP